MPDRDMELNNDITKGRIKNKIENKNESLLLPRRTLLSGGRVIREQSLYKISFILIEMQTFNSLG